MSTLASRHGPQAAAFELCFRRLGDEKNALAFPCDPTGHIDLDALSERKRTEYLYARTLVGCEFARPAVRQQLPQ